MAKKNDGKSLEKTIQLIQETFKESENTSVYLSHKMLCESGIEREFDVLIKSKINDFDICIAIECKDYNSKVSIDRIESFKSKCSTIKEINKMVFVSSKGYQSGAITQAKNFGIELMTAEQISTDYLQSLIANLSQFNLKLSLDDSNIAITMASHDIDNECLVESAQSYNDFVLEYSTGRKILITELMNRGIVKFSPISSQLALRHYVANKLDIENNSSFPVNIEIAIPPKTFYFEDNKLNKIDVIKIDFKITVTMNRISSVNSGRVIKNNDNTIKAHSIKLDNDDKSVSELILKPDNNFKFFYTKDKETTELKTLAKYDSITKQFITINNNDV